MKLFTSEFKRSGIMNTCLHDRGRNELNDWLTSTSPSTLRCQKTKSNEIDLSRFIWFHLHKVVHFLLPISDCKNGFQYPKLAFLSKFIYFWVISCLCIGNGRHQKRVKFDVSLKKDLMNQLCFATAEILILRYPSVFYDANAICNNFISNRNH